MGNMDKHIKLCFDAEIEGLVMDHFEELKYSKQELEEKRSAVLNMKNMAIVDLYSMVKTDEGQKELAHHLMCWSNKYLADLSTYNSIYEEDYEKEFARIKMDHRTDTRRRDELISNLQRKSILYSDSFCLALNSIVDYVKLAMAYQAILDNPKESYYGVAINKLYADAIEKESKLCEEAMALVNAHFSNLLEDAKKDKKVIEKLVADLKNKYSTQHIASVQVESDGRIYKSKSDEFVLLAAQKVAAAEGIIKKDNSHYKKDESKRTKTKE